MGIGKRFRFLFSTFSSLFFHLSLSLSLSCKKTCEWLDGTRFPIESSSNRFFLADFQRVPTLRKSDPETAYQLAK